LVYDQAAISATTTGSVTLSGTGGSGLGGGHRGVQISSISTGTTPVSVVDGNLSITGTGGTSSSGSGNTGGGVHRECRDCAFHGVGYSYRERYGGKQQCSSKGWW
jgi:hypothetical protein